MPGYRPYTSSTARRRVHATNLVCPAKKITHWSWRVAICRGNPVKIYEPKDQSVGVVLLWDS
jgi:hypothetical protein